MNTRLLVIGIIIFTFISCIDSILGERYVKTIKNTSRNLENCYKIEGLFDHYPESISNKDFVSMFSWVPDHLIYPENRFKASHHLLLSVNENIERFYPDTFIYQTLYTENNFIVDLGFKYYTQLDTLKIRNVSVPNTYPIPYFEDYDFGLGDVELKYWYDEDVEATSNKYNTPEDLEVFVLKAKKGDYWKKECDSKRPKSLNEWRNGCTSGIAISMLRKMVVFWVSVW